MARASLREKLLTSGVETLHRRGYGAAGVREITGVAGVPQGSFTNHFGSKEAFGIAVLERYFQNTAAILDATLGDGARRPLERLCGYFDAIIARLADEDWRYGCLISNLSLEAAEHSEPIRIRLAVVFTELTRRFAEMIAEAQAAGELSHDVAPDDLADVLLCAWHGAMLRMKVERSPEPLRRFKQVFLGTLFATPAAGLALERSQAEPRRNE